MAVHSLPRDPSPSTVDQHIAEFDKPTMASDASGERRRVGPMACDRKYSGVELELMHAMQAYKVSSGRMFPTWSEVLEVLQGLGYRKDA
jgi:hypothetical protein